MDRFDGQKLAEVQTALGGVHVPRAPLALFHFLWTRRGTVVAWESLIDFMESTYSGWTTLDIRDVQGYLKKVRRAIRDHGWPCKIETFYGIGVKLTATDPKWGAEIP
ncbi:helix-turn-helix domain-containing protein [Seohaeicola zhoushanensis]|uniref:OmpR/PhoB-type domain-containing protein n=1 Tax=Seohaeicola zhoushanensis TaxID=1569283 RepID=A0A8J3M9X3_9RHOB|nr:helix-turn-helix domain-containing protein [Seohaeicola zhoushanensis]GHF71293.1 hypothetical protein GCM10017056_47770 [Seohaeicola zhoushanensis]